MKEISLIYFIKFTVLNIIVISTSIHTHNFQMFMFISKVQIIIFEFLFAIYLQIYILIKL